MGSQALSPKTLRRISRSTGLDIIWGSSSGGYWHRFTTSTHLHGFWNKKSEEFEIVDPQDKTYDDQHGTSCSRFFPEEMAEHSRQFQVAHAPRRASYLRETANAAARRASEGLIPQSLADEAERKALLAEEFARSVAA